MQESVGRRTNITFCCGNQNKAVAIFPAFCKLGYGFDLSLSNPVEIVAVPFRDL